MEYKTATDAPDARLKIHANISSIDFDTTRNLLPFPCSSSCIGCVFSIIVSSFGTTHIAKIWIPTWKINN